MSENRLSLIERFQAGVLEYLEQLSDQLIPVLRQLVEYPFPIEVAYLDFEVFCDGFTQEFPVRVFFMDVKGCEYFEYHNSQAEYPCNVNPQLLQLDCVYPREFEERFMAEDESLDTFTLAGETFIPWFARCWTATGGSDFKRGALIGLHDNFERYDLVRQRWLRR